MDPVAQLTVVRDVGTWDEFNKPGARRAGRGAVRDGVPEQQRLQPA